MQLAALVGEHRDHAGFPWSEDKNSSKEINYVRRSKKKNQWTVGRRQKERTRSRLTRNLGGGGGVQVGCEAVDVLRVRVEDRLPRLLLAALHCASHQSNYNN